MFKSILVPIDLADTDLAKPAIATAVSLSQPSNGDHQAAERAADDAGDARGIRAGGFRRAAPPVVARKRWRSSRARSGIEPSRISSVVRQGGIYHEILEEAQAINADLIVMSSHRPAMKTYFLGSNAGHVVRYAKCSVLVVRN